LDKPPLEDLDQDWFDWDDFGAEWADSKNVRRPQHFIKLSQKEEEHNSSRRSYTIAQHLTLRNL
jgi:hypothetical protein